MRVKCDLELAKNQPYYIKIDPPIVGLPSLRFLGRPSHWRLALSASPALAGGAAHFFDKT
jgi:hypothetical protein